MSDILDTPPSGDSIFGRPVIGFSGYTVTEDGDVFRWFFRNRNVDRILKSPVKQAVRISNKGYPVVSISKDGSQKTKLVHHLILEAFVSPRPHGLVARHLNGRPRDCRRDNLQWGTRSQNYYDMILHGTVPQGERNGVSKLTRTQVRKIKSRPDLSAGYFSRKFGVTRECIYAIRDGKNWTHLK